MGKIEVELEDVKALLDIATGSMDWGSGFLDHEEVGVLRRVAVQIGSDPIDATPNEWRAQYAHPYKPATKYRWIDIAGQRLRERQDYVACENCPHDEADPIHHGVDNVAASEETP